MRSWREQLTRGAQAARAGLASGVERSPAVRAGVRRLRDEMAAALDTDIYGGGYFGIGRDPLDRAGLSGYERYDRESSNADVAAYLAWRYFSPTTTLDVGCATGFVVEALAEVGCESAGCDFSQWAVDHPAAGAVGRLRWADSRARLPYPSSSFDVVTVLETLEHLDPGSVPAALASIRRVCRGHVIATIPSFGPNAHGPGGVLEGKVKDDRLADLYGLGPEYSGPVLESDLMLDSEGRPIEGHLTIASFAWWTQRFTEAGFRRCGPLEERLHEVLGRCALSGHWDLYVFEVPDAPTPIERPAEEVRELELRWGLDRRPLSEERLGYLRTGLGAAAVERARLLLPPRTLA